MEIFGIIVCAVGAAFCFIYAGALTQAHDGASSEEDMLDMFADIL